MHSIQPTKHKSGRLGKGRFDNALEPIESRILKCANRNVVLVMTKRSEPTSVANVALAVLICLNLANTSNFLPSWRSKYRNRNQSTLDHDAI